VARQFDGRGPATLLTDMVLGEMGLSHPTELIHAVYESDLQRDAIAGIAFVVQRAADAGDAVAAALLDRASGELATGAASVISQLGMRGDVFPTVLAGGVFRGLPSLVTMVAGRIAEVAPRSEVRPLDVEPAMGAVTLALAAARGIAVIPAYL
jgi:N-acetylglucosamine kinase-like BadF-type ATPase